MHMVALDGVYARDGDTPLFHEVCAPSSADMQRLLDVIVARVLRCLVHDGLLIRDAEQPWRGLDPVPDCRGPACRPRGADVEVGGSEVAFHGAEAVHGGS